LKLEGKEVVKEKEIRRRAKVRRFVVTRLFERAGKDLNFWTLPEQ